jgi:hypothetical protein
MAKIRAEDIPQEVIAPQDWTLWRVTAVREGKACQSTFIRSHKAQDEIEEIGKRALRMAGVRGRYAVKVTQYFPWLDPVMAGHFVYNPKG